MKLSDRLMAVATFVTPGENIVDIGTDHGYVPIYLIKKEIFKHAIAMDINKGPILRANEHILEEGLEDYIETRISDGFEKINPGEAECAIIAGMGGELITKILKNGKNVVNTLNEMILSPHSEIFLVRKYLHENGFKIIDEKMLIDEDKFYTIIKAVHGNDKIYSEEEYKYGAILIEKKDEILKKYLLRELKKIDKINENLNENFSDNTRIRIDELTYKKNIILCILQKMK